MSLILFPKVITIFELNHLKLYVNIPAIRIELNLMIKCLLIELNFFQSIVKLVVSCKWPFVGLVSKSEEGMRLDTVNQ